MSLSSTSDPYSSSSWPPGALDDTSSCGIPNGTGSHDGSPKVGCAEGPSGNGTTDGAQDGAQDGMQDSAQDSATDKTGDGTTECPQEGAADKTIDDAWDKPEPNDADVKCNVDQPQGTFVK